MKLDRVIDILGWYPDAVNNVEKEFKQAVKQVTKWKEDAEKFEMVDSLFAELEIPLPYDLWLANSLKNNKVVEHMKKLLDTYKNEEWEEEFLRKMVVRELQETFSLEEGKAVAEAQWIGEENELAKDDLEWLDRIGVDDRRMKIILKNKEDAEKWNNNTIELCVE